MNGYSEASSGNAGLILKVRDAGKGADAFSGYEVSLTTEGRLVLGRHRHNWEPLREVACPVPLQQWIALSVQITTNSLDIRVNGQALLHYQDDEHPLINGTVGLRTWQRAARFRSLWVSTQASRKPLSFQPASPNTFNLSRLWHPIVEGASRGSFSLTTEHAFVGRQSQQLAFTSGTGVVGIENQGLNRWGLSFVAHQPYEGCLWARSEVPTACFVALESADGKTIGAEKQIWVTSNHWQRLSFTLTPHTALSRGRFALKLKQPGRLDVGYVFLQPGPWGRFKGQPVRRDVAQGLIDQGITVLRYGGSMVNAEGYRWKKMVGPRELRPPYRGTWYPHSSNGWGILDFVSFCKTAGFLGIPAFNLNETPEDMGDFIEYVNGAKDSVWGARRVRDGHPKPFGLKYLELGNEECVNEHYATRFEALAKAIWAKDPQVVLVVGDFGYEKPIKNPFHFTGADSGITSLAAQQRILELAKSQHREVWFDVHVGTDGPRPAGSLEGALSFRQALERISDGARFRVVVFELNAGNHSQRRALANALAIQAFERDGHIPVVTSANGLQPDGQNDNGWDQGLLFLNPEKVWLQPPGYVTRMLSRHYLPRRVACRSTSAGDQLEANAKISENGKTLEIQVVNLSDQSTPVTLKINGFKPRRHTVQVEELAGALNAHNTAGDPHQVQSQATEWTPQFQDGLTNFRFAAHSYTLLRFR